MATFSIPKIVKKDIPHSNFNMECVRRTPATVGVHIPIYHQDVLPDDYFNIPDVAARIKTMPFVTSLMGSFRVQLDWYFEPLSNLYGFMDNNETLSTNTILSETLHRGHTLQSGSVADYGIKFDQTAGGVGSWDMAQKFILNNSIMSLGVGYVPDCSIMNFLGFPAGFDAAKVVDNQEASYQHIDNYPSSSQVGIKWFNLHSFYAYHDIVRTYYSNKQAKFVRYYQPHAPVDDLSDHGWAYYDNTEQGQYVDIDQSVLDGLFLELRNKTSDDRITPAGFNVSGTSTKNFNKFWSKYGQMFIGASPMFQLDPSTAKVMFSVVRHQAFSGLACSQYRPDIFQTILLPNTSSVTSTVSVDNQVFTIPSLRVASHYQQLIDLYDVSGGQFSHWIKSQWDVEISGHTDTPILLQSSHRMITVDDVYSTARTDKGFVGEQSGTINTNAGFRGIKFHSRQYGVLMAILTIVPEVDYSQGIGFQLDYTNFADLYTPAMANLGFESIPYSNQFVCYGNDVVTSPYEGRFTFLRDGQRLDTPYGRSVHWYRYMTDVNKVFGAFSRDRSLNAWCLSKSAFSLYVNPADWNYMFAYQGLGSQNWFVQMYFDVQATRAIPKFVQGTIV